MSADKIYLTLKKHLTKKEVAIVLVTASIRNYRDISLAVVKYFVNERKHPGIYVTTNQPYPTLQEQIRQEGVDPDKIIFIDAITGLSGMAVEREAHCFYLKSPQNLTDLSIALTEAISAISTKEKFLIFDSLSTLLIYNPPETVAKFLHFLVSKMRMWAVEGIILTVEKDIDRQLLSQVFKFFDVVIDLTQKEAHGQ